MPSWLSIPAWGLLFLWGRCFSLKPKLAWTITGLCSGWLELQRPLSGPLLTQC